MTLVNHRTLPESFNAWFLLIFPANRKDVRLPVQLQRAMAAEAEAAREARAKVIAAEGEQKASKALKAAAEVISGSPAALQVHLFKPLCFPPSFLFFLNFALYIIRCSLLYWSIQITTALVDQWTSRSKLYQ